MEGAEASKSCLELEGGGQRQQSDMLRNRIQKQNYNKRNIWENSFGGEKRDY